MMAVFVRSPDGRSYWLAEGNGPMRRIIAEGSTRLEAMRRYAEIYARQYAEGEAMTSRSMLVSEGYAEDLG